MAQNKADEQAGASGAAASSAAPKRGHPRYRLDSGRIVAFMGSPGGFWQVTYDAGSGSLTPEEWAQCREMMAGRRHADLVEGP